MNSFEYADAADVPHAIALTINGSAIKAGGIDLLDLMKEGIASPARLINIRNIPGLDQIKSDAAGLAIGPLVTLSQLSMDPAVQKNFAALAQAAGLAATPQVRNMATLGGNLLQRPRCWYFRNEQFHCRKKGGEICYAQDGENQYHAIFNNRLCAIVHPSATAVPLVAMGAKVELTGLKGVREVALEEFFRLPSDDLHRENALADGEVMTAIRVPPLGPGAVSHYIKQGEKESFDWPIAEVAVVLQRDGEVCKSISIVLGAAAPVPHRAKEAEFVLANQKITDDAARRAADAAMAGAQPLALNGYKVPLFKVLIARAILACARA
jgi:xanthine dehydrogenase YagS FAD-binding subunit